ncbi:acid protease [Multifurca ochricompacta]|uniref:Acid protease n=1 Tax=Multifurca ochricompacta TaxID=376703 RepID=A0AAD4M6T1_9AGAM|nr:acid protease [Multifurca ochricompacta]
MVPLSTFCIFLSIFFPSLSLALPINLPQRTDSITSFELPIQRQRAVRSGTTLKRGIYSGNTGLGDFLDLFYTVSITIGQTVTAVNIDTGSSDLWVVSDACKTSICKSTDMPAYPSASIKPAGGSVKLLYGDSSTGTHASGPVALDTGVIAGLSMAQQPFAAISDTNNTSVMQGANGIFGLGFPSGSQVQSAVINAKFNTPPTTDDFVRGTASDGPLLSRLAMSGSLEQPMFAVMLQRDIIDVSGKNGALTIGKLPDGIDNSSLTWVPVRLYKPEDGGLIPPTFAPNETYPLRWEVPIDGVILDGQRLPTSKFSGSGSTISALLDTGNSLIRGPQDVVDSILRKVSSAFAADSNAEPTFPCSLPHDLAFQIGGKTFPVDPRDFMSQKASGDSSTCVANNIVGTDPPESGALFSWSFGDPFFKSNLVAFYYGNLTHPSVDPPRIGFLSMVPDNANSIVQDDIAQAQANGGNFESTSQAAPTSVASPVVLSPTSISTPTITTTTTTTTSSLPLLRL